MDTLKCYPWYVILIIVCANISLHIIILDISKQV